MMLLCSLWVAVAAEPGIGVVEGPAARTDWADGYDRLVDEVEIPWTRLGFRAAREEEPAVGPEWLAVDSDGDWALWDPVRRAVVGSEGSVGLSFVSSMVFDDDGTLWVLDERARVILALRDGVIVSREAKARLCPTGVALVVVDGEVRGRDPFGGLHVVQEGGGAGSRLAWPRVRVDAGRVTVDGLSLAAPADTLAARLYGDWLVIEAGEPGALRVRQAVSRLSGRVVPLPLLRDERYRPLGDVVGLSDGSFAWLEARESGVTLHRAWP
jgi:hypothetical protein